MTDRIVELLVAGELQENFAKVFAPTELRLGMLPGMLASIVTDPDYMSVIRMIATIEPVINSAIEIEMTRATGGLGGISNREKFSALAQRLATYSPLNGKLGRSQIALDLKLITKSDFHFIESLSFVRNRYAHNIKNSVKNLKSICDQASTDDKKFYSKLTHGSAFDPERQNNFDLKMAVITSFSIFLVHMEDHHKMAFVGLFDALFPSSGQN